MFVSYFILKVFFKIIFIQNYFDKLLYFNLRVLFFDFTERDFSNGRQVIVEFEMFLCLRDVQEVYGSYFN